MTAKRKKTKRKPRRRKQTVIDRIFAGVEDLVYLAEEGAGPESRWSRPRKRRISLRVDAEVVDWFKSKGPGYQTRINRILRRVMVEGKRQEGDK